MLVYIKPKSLIPKLHSDRLFGALTSVISELFPEELDNMISDFKNNSPPFLLSSTFPCIWINNEKIRFFPKIIGNESCIGAKLNDLKDYKKVEYLEESLFFDLIKNDDKIYLFLVKESTNEIMDFVLIQFDEKLEKISTKEFSFKSSNFIDGQVGSVHEGPLVDKNYLYGW